MANSNHILCLCLFLFLFLLLSSLASAANVSTGKSPFTAKASFIRYWKKHVSGDLPKPWFLNKASPLDGVQLATFSKLADQNLLATKLDAFCSDANLLCYPEMTSFGKKNDKDVDFTAYNFTNQNFTNYGTQKIRGIDTFKNYSDGEQFQFNSFTRYSRHSTGHDEKFKFYAPDTNVPDTEFKSYGKSATSGSGDFTNYNDYLVLGVNFTSYSDTSSGRKQEFKTYGDNTVGGNDTFKSYGKKGNAAINDFVGYGNNTNVDASEFSNYGEVGKSANDTFTTYGSHGNNPSNLFNNYETGGNTSKAAFSNYIDSGNAGNQAFQSYGKGASAAKNDFISYANESNAGTSEFSNYGEDGKSVNDTFTTYDSFGNGPSTRFNNYEARGNTANAAFSNYGDKANVGDDAFESYGKGASSGNISFANYDYSVNVRNTSFNSYGKNAQNQSVDFTNYGRNTTTFKEYTKKGVTFSDYFNGSSFLYTQTKAAGLGSAEKNMNIINRWIEPGKFFREAMLKTGKIMPMPDIHDKMPRRSFLPRRIIVKLPFSSSKIEELQKIFRARDDSTMSGMIKNALTECERAPSPGETKHCVGSAEDMVDFATSVLGRNIVVRTTENTHGSKADVLIGSVKGINGGNVTKSVSCHQSLFPYLLYYCHSVPKVRVYEADILDPKSKEKINQGTAICHIDTSSWSSNHGAFLALGLGPGKIEVCHWIFENDMTWTTAD